MAKRKFDLLKESSENAAGLADAGSPRKQNTKKLRKQKKQKKSPAASSISAKPEPELPPTVRKSDQEPPRRGKWTNKQRVLVFSSRGIGMRDRHLMQDFRTVMPHSKTENKMNKKDKLVQINEACEMKNCNMALYFEARKRRDLYLWVAKTPGGPSAKFLVENIHTLEELKMTGNCLKGTRPILSFDKGFDAQPHFALLRELFAQVFNTPNHHPKSQPFFDRIMSFSVVDNRIWIRNFQIAEESGALAEIGPRLTLNLIKIFDGSFRGECIFENSRYVSPNLHRRNTKLAAAGKYIDRVQTKVGREERKPETAYPLEDEVDDVFRTAESLKRDPEAVIAVNRPKPNKNKFKKQKNPRKKQ